MTRKIFSITLCLFFVLPLAYGQKKQSKKSEPVQTVKVGNLLNPAPYGSVHFEDYLGDKIDLCINNGLMKQDIERVVQPFRDKPDGKWGFRSEFWGKWYTAAVWGYGYAPTPENRAVIDEAVNELMATQDANGYIGTYLDENHLGEWDIWGRKYVMLGLLAYYEQTKDPKALESAMKVADHLIKEAGPESGVNIAATGWIGWKGLPSSSVLEPIALLYQITGEQRYLDFGEHIIKMWESPNAYAPAGLHLIEQALDGTPMWEIGGASKAYEMTSCFEGLCEMYRVTGNKLYLEACDSYINSIIRDELMIVGSASMAEIWCNGKVRQSDPMYLGMETCVTATWMKFLYQMLRLTGNSKYADQLEISLYNAMLAAMTPRGNWWSYYTSLMGDRVPSHMQFPDVGMSCCVANGPRGLMTAPSWAVMTDDKGIVVNLYSPMTAKIATPAGQQLGLKFDTDYPRNGKISIAVNVPQEERFALSLRIPEWSKRSSIVINGQRYGGLVVPGTYASIDRKWSPNDKVEVELDMRAKVVGVPGGMPDAAITRGPIALAFDTRQVPLRYGVDTPPMYRYKFLADKEGYIDVKLQETSTVPEIWMTFDVPLVDEAGGRHTLPMCDFVSAGNTWEKGNFFRTWVPQPFDFRHLYIYSIDWRLNYPDGTERPQIPE